MVSPSSVLAGSVSVAERGGAGPGHLPGTQSESLPAAAGVHAAVLLAGGAGDLTDRPPRLAGVGARGDLASAGAARRLDGGGRRRFGLDPAPGKPFLPGIDAGEPGVLG